MISFQNVSKKFKTDFWATPFLALDDISFELPQNKIIGFLGANGAGKTTSLKILLGYIMPTAGKVHFSESLGQNRKEIMSNLGYFPERPYFYPHLTGREFISFMSELHGMSDKNIKKETIRLSERFKIDHALDRKIHNYSKGMLQRLGFITAIIHNPKIIILDEPLSGLDPIGRKEFKDVIVELNRNGKTVFFSSHIVPDMEEICQTVIYLEKGKLVYQGPIDKIIRENIRPDFTIAVHMHQEYSGNVPVKLVLKNIEEKNYFYNVKAEDKEMFIQDVLNKEGTIFNLQQNKPSLEDIFYKIRNVDNGTT